MYLSLSNFKTKHSYISDLKITVVETQYTAMGTFKDRYHYCLYCETPKPIVKIIRHLEAKHMDEMLVQSFSRMDIKSKERKKITTDLRLQGNHRHNLEVIEKGEGVLLVAKASSDPSKSWADYVPCKQCFGYYVKQELSRHKCPTIEGDEMRKKGTVKEGRGIIESARNKFSEESAEILAPMLDDEVGDVVKKDPLIREILDLEIQKGEYMKPLWVKEIRQRLRLLGKDNIFLQKAAQNM